MEEGEREFMSRCYDWWEEEMAGMGWRLQDGGGWESE